MSTYLVTFKGGCIGRTHKVPPLTVQARSLKAMGGAILRYARRYLLSRDVAVLVDPDSNRGTVVCGSRTGAEFVYRLQDRQEPATGTREETRP